MTNSIPLSISSARTTSRTDPVDPVWQAQDFAARLEETINASLPGQARIRASKHRSRIRVLSVDAEGTPARMPLLCGGAHMGSWQLSMLTTMSRDGRFLKVDSAWPYSPSGRRRRSSGLNTRRKVPSGPRRTGSSMLSVAHCRSSSLGLIRLAKRPTRHIRSPSCICRSEQTLPTRCRGLRRVPPPRMRVRRKAEVGGGASGWA